MYFQFGPYRHDENEGDITNLDIHRMYSPRNKLFFMRHTLSLKGHLCVSGQEAIKSKISELEQAYRVTGSTAPPYGYTYDAGLYHDDGARSAHFLEAHKAINGVRLLNLSYQKEDGGEYATGRSYSIVLQADFLSPESQIHSFQETVQFIGNCGPKWELVPTALGPPVVEFVHWQTVQRIIQSGSAVGIQAHPAMPGQLLPNEYKHGDESFWEFGSAEMICANGIYSGLLFPARWRYVFSSGVPKSFYPHYDYPEG